MLSPSAAPLSRLAMFLAPNSGREWVGEFEALRFLREPRRLVLGLRPGLRAVAAACESCRTFSLAPVTRKDVRLSGFSEKASMVFTVEII